MNTAQSIMTLSVGLLLTLQFGCHVNREFGPPGDMNTQRTRAMLHDPFPAGDDLGPAIEGARPRGFDLPRDEIQKLQTSPNARRGSQATFGGF